MTPEIFRVMVAPWTLRRGLRGLSRDQQNDVDMRSAWAWWTTYSELAEWARRSGTSLSDPGGVIWVTYEEMSRFGRAIGGGEKCLPRKPLAVALTG